MVARNKFSRLVKSTIYYEDKNNRCKLLCKFLRGELEFKDY